VIRYWIRQNSRFLWITLVIRLDLVEPWYTIVWPSYQQCSIATIPALLYSIITILTSLWQLFFLYTILSKTKRKSVYSSSSKQIYLAPVAKKICKSAYCKYSRSQHSHGLLQGRFNRQHDWWKRLAYPTHSTDCSHIEASEMLSSLTDEIKRGRLVLGHKTTTGISTSTSRTHETWEQKLYRKEVSKGMMIHTLVFDQRSGVKAVMVSARVAYNRDWGWVEVAQKSETVVCGKDADWDNRWIVLFVVVGSPKWGSYGDTLRRDKSEYM